MFSSNQKLEVSGDFSQLQSALRFAIDHYEGNHNHICYQTTDDGKFCIGWGDSDKKQAYEGWENFQFDYDAEIVSKIIIQFLNKQKSKDSAYKFFDGCTDKGFIMKVIPETFSDEQDDIKNPFYGIVSFETFTNFYSK